MKGKAEVIKYMASWNRKNTRQSIQNLIFQSQLERADEEYATTRNRGVDKRVRGVKNPCRTRPSVCRKIPYTMGKMRQSFFFSMLVLTFEGKGFIKVNS